MTIYQTHMEEIVWCRFKKRCLMLSAVVSDLLIETPKNSMFCVETIAGFSVGHGPELLFCCIVTPTQPPSPKLLLTGHFRQGWELLHNENHTRIGAEPKLIQTNSLCLTHYPSLLI